jgi:hypothetical protein
MEHSRSRRLNDVTIHVFGFVAPAKRRHHPGRRNKVPEKKRKVAVHWRGEIITKRSHAGRGQETKMGNVKLQ